MRLARYQADLEKSSTNFQEAMTRVRKSLPATIDTIEDYRKATDILAFVGMRTKAIDMVYKYYYAPAKAKADEIKAKFSEFMLPLAQLEATVKDKMKPFILAEQARADAEQAKIEKAAMKKNKGDAMIMVPVVNDIKTQKGNFGTSTAKKLPRWRVKNESKIPDKYWMLNEVLIGQDNRAGKEIPGIEKYFDISISKRSL